MRWMIGLILALLLAGCAAGNGRDLVTDDACHPVPTPQVSVDISFIGPVNDRSRGVIALSHEDTDGRGPAMGHGAATFGITHVLLAGQFMGEAETAQLANGDFCAWSTRLVIHLRDEVRVYLASELQPGTCTYSAVRDHEEKHVRLDRQLRPALQDGMEGAAGKVAAFSVRGANREAAEARLHTALRQAINGALSDFAARRDQLQIAIDTPQEYQRVLNVCGGPAFAALVPAS